MAGVTATDPAAFFREMLDQWEAMANRYGGEAMKSAEAARTMGAATIATAQFHEATRDTMARALAAANMPSRAEVTGLSERMAAIDDRLARIEAMIAKLTGAPAPGADRPKPARSKKPPKAAA